MSGGGESVFGRYENCSPSSMRYEPSWRFQFKLLRGRPNMTWRAVHETLKGRGKILGRRKTKPMGHLGHAKLSVLQKRLGAVDSAAVQVFNGGHTNLLAELGFEVGLGQGGDSGQLGNAHGVGPAFVNPLQHPADVLRRSAGWIGASAVDHQRQPFNKRGANAQLPQGIVRPFRLAVNVLENRLELLVAEKMTLGQMLKRPDNRFGLPRREAEKRLGPSGESNLHPIQQPFALVGRAAAVRLSRACPEDFVALEPIVLAACVEALFAGDQIADLHGIGMAMRGQGVARLGDLMDAEAGHLRQANLGQINGNTRAF